MVNPMVRPLQHTQITYTYYKKNIKKTKLHALPGAAIVYVFLYVLSWNLIVSENI